MNAQQRLERLSQHLIATAANEASINEKQMRSAATASPASNCGPLLQDQVCLITGSAQGIGQATAKLFAQHKAKLMLTDLDQAKLQKTVDEINTQFGENTARGLAGDITEETLPQRLVEAALQSFGGQINCLVNLAGFCEDVMLHKCTDQQFTLQYAVHVVAPFRLIRALAPLWRDAANKDQVKCIVNVSSVAVHGNTGQVNYSAAKSALTGLTKTVAKEWGGFGVRCNTVGQSDVEAN